MDLKQGDLENIILNALWDLEQSGMEKVFVGDVQERINSRSKTWAYTTVKTVLDRLVDKRMAGRRKDGKKYLYASILKRDEAGMVALSKVLRQYFQGDVSQLNACLKRLSPEAVVPALTPESMFERTRSLNQMHEIQGLASTGV